MAFGRGDVEETIEIAAHYAVEDAAEEVGRFGPLEQLMQRIGISEGVERCDPVRELILDVEAHDPERGNVGNGLRQLHRLRPFAQGALERVQADERIIHEELIREIWPAGPGFPRAFSQHAGKLFECAAQHRKKVDWMAPGILLLATGLRCTAG